MVSSDERLKKVSDVIYQEANPPEDRHRPLEWPRNFNFVCLALKNVKIISNFNVHDSMLPSPERRINVPAGWLAEPRPRKLPHL